MTCYNIRLEGDVLKVDFAKTPDGEAIHVDGNQIVKDVAKQLERMISLGELKGGNLLKIYGRISLLTSYTFAHQVGHLYRAIAVSDTRLSAYIVAVSTTDDYPVGSRIDFNTGAVTQVHRPSARPSFLIDWENDLLIAKISNGKEADGDQILRDANAQLERLINSGKLSGGNQLLKINGRSTVLAGFLIADRLAHRYSSLAVFDPKLGKYVVTVSHSQDYRVGQVLNGERAPQSRSPVKVVLCGPANAGKTVLRDGLKAAILKLESAPSDFYAISGCPDGDGAFYSETAQKYPELARELKREYKAKFTPEFARAKARDIQRIKNSLLLFDVGGKIDVENQIIMSEATHAAILAKTEADVIAWQDFCEHQLQKPLEIVAIIYSNFNGREDRIDNESPILGGSVHHLERGEDVSDRPMIQALARKIVELIHL